MNESFGRLSENNRGVEVSAPAQAAAAPALTPAQYVEVALVHHGAGRLTEAESLYRKVLAMDEKNFDALHLLGVVHHQNGDSVTAIELIERAVAVAPGNSFAHANLGLAYQALNRLDNAESSLRRAIALQPDWDRAHNNLGTVLRAAGRLDDADACFAKAAQLNPSSTEALNNLGNVCKERGQLVDAEKFYRKALAIDSALSGTWRNLGQVLQRSRRFDDAMDCYRKALDLRPDDAEVLVDVGTIHESRTELADAERCFLRALQLDGNLVEAMSNLGDVLRRLDRLDEAERYCRKALANRPDDPNVLNSLAAVLMRFSSLDEAEKCCRKALSIRADHSLAQITLGSILNARDCPVEAEACFRLAMRISPQLAAAPYNLSMLKLLQGDYKEGLELYESRFDALDRDIGCSPEIRQLLKDNRRWRGETLSGQRLLIWTEQGFGDSLMMLRYLPMLKGRGAGEVIVMCEPELRRIVCSVSGLDSGVTCTQSASASDFDLHCPIMSLPFLFHTTPRSVPGQVPYLSVPDKIARAWKKRMASFSGTRVGLAWSGSRILRDDAKRSIPLSAFEPVIASEGVQFFSLQKGEGAEQIAAWQGRIVDWMDDCDDFLDTAALVHNLDLVISVDSAVVHLAGALGKPVWLLNRYGSEWRWGPDSENSPWYPSARIFRQREATSWDEVIVQVATELTKFQRT